MTTTKGWAWRRSPRQTSATVRIVRGAKVRYGACFTDQDAEVRKSAASCFRHIAADRLDAYGDLIEAFCASPAFGEAPFHVLHALKDARSQLPGTVCLVCESLLDRQRRHADGYMVVDLIFRLYQHHQNDQWTSRALDLIDRACLELDGATEGFEDYDR